jgi:hypothetical protein
MSRILAAVLVTCLVSSCALPRPAPTAASSDWAQVTALRVDTPIEVYLADGREIRGAITAVDVRAVVLDRTSVIRREEVLTLSTLHGDNRTLGILGGAAMGLVIGSTSDAGGNGAAGIPLFLAAVGSIAGYGVGKRSPRKQLVYARPF